MDKKIFYIVGLVGTLIGGFVPMVFGADGLSLWSILGGGIGGVGTIWLTYRLSQ
jgi:hypothetical protein